MFTAAIKAVLFDMDGVLVDVSKSYRRAIEETVYYFTGRKVYPRMIQRYKNLGGFNDDWALTRAIVMDSGMEVSLQRIINEFQRRYRGDDWSGFIQEETPLIESITLDALRQHGCVLGIVTGRPEAEARWTLDRLGWKHIFPLLIAREKQGHRSKPDPFPLQQALGALRAAGLSLKPKNAVYLGDSVDDMAAARAGGLWAIGVVPPYVDYKPHSELLQQRGAHLVTGDPNNLPELIGTLIDPVGQEANP